MVRFTFLFGAALVVLALSSNSAEAQFGHSIYGHTTHGPVGHRAGHAIGGGGLHGGVSLQIGGLRGSSFGYSSAFAGTQAYSSGYVNPYSSFGYTAGRYVAPPVYHDTTHLDFHPATIIRHGTHFHVAPPHYDVHHSGHYHR